ncbi:HET-domain-containing protein [Setomelanomma holmii]|uniref:HET-domain-containing protein n=1 Tax=Setomelanomma holmii TaxID=210430 RepID=A0A9P4HA66_9PLEO|nr:HET-domain-containing protein [Setomelanomma holmii]
MRLLKYGEDGEPSVTADLVDEDAIPRYAILSHRWGEDAEEVTFEDLAKNTGRDKSGYRKVQLCGEQAQRDGLQYFWIDTCCINKANKAEHSLAIRSMFRWYRNAARCYVYLSDVPAPPLGHKGEARPPLGDIEFKASEWFTHGWTLQELLAPGVVEFFSREWIKLGDRISLMQQIHETTGIPHKALDGAPLPQFSVAERLRWKGDRETKRIFDVEIAPAYSEGAPSAFGRLMDEIHTRERCIQDARHTDPRDDKRPIKKTKGGLLADSYRWILNNTTFQLRLQDPHSRLLWVKGDPGKGKTMLLCGIINELYRSMPSTTLLSYFFCQATDSRINNPTAVLQGLLYMLVVQQPLLISHVRKKHDHTGKSLFEDANTWVVWTEIFVDVLQDPSLRPTYLVIDALDECVTDLPMLLDFVAKQSSVSSRVKWIVSSRNWPDVEAQLERAGHKVRLSLELNAESVVAAVAVFVQRKVDHLAQEQQYNADVQDAVLQHLTSNANDTFLWVALVCHDLQATANRHVLKKLAVFPPGLDDLYKRMMQQMSKSDNADTCRCVLASTALVELVEQLKDISSDVREIIDLCGSFLTVRKDTVYFVHQSAKDFLFSKASNEPGSAVENVEPPHPDPLVAWRYPCIYWIDHLHDSKPKSSANSIADFHIRAVHNFLREKYLYWLEGLSLCKSLGTGVVPITKLWLLLQVQHLDTACLY